MNDNIDLFWRSLSNDDLTHAESIARINLRRGGLEKMIGTLFSKEDKLSDEIFLRLLKLPSMRLSANSTALILCQWHQQDPRSVCDWLSSTHSQCLSILKEEIISLINMHDLRSNIQELMGDDALSVFIKPGIFEMGSYPSERGHERGEEKKIVTIENAFIVRRFPITNMQWNLLMESRFEIDLIENNQKPVVWVDWFEAIEYCNDLSIIMDLPECYAIEGFARSESISVEWLQDTGYRLPTEAEWEFFCRAGTSTTTYAGNFVSARGQDTEPTLNAIAWYDRYDLKTVALKAPNPWGLYDTIGLVAEWCWDTPASVPVPRLSKPSNEFRVTKGGSFAQGMTYQRAASRDLREAANRYIDCGFRCVRTILPKPY